MWAPKGGWNGHFSCLKHVLNWHLYLQCRFYHSLCLNMVHTDHQRIGFQALYADFSSQDKNHFQTAQSKNYVFKEIQNKAERTFM